MSNFKNGVSPINPTRFNIMKWVALGFSSEGILFGFLLTSVSIYANPKNDPKDLLIGTIFYLGTSIIACFSLKLISSDFKSCKVIKPDSYKKWLFVVLGIFISILAYVGGIVFIYAITTPMPYFAAIFFIIMALISSYLFNYAANIASQRTPNLIRWIVILFVGCSQLSLGLCLSLILIYASPTMVSEVYSSAIAYFGTVIYTCLIINVASNYVSTRG